MDASAVSPPLVALNRLNEADQSALRSCIVSLQARDETATKTRRRTWILECIQYLTPFSILEDNARILDFWKVTLLESERNDAEIVYKLLEYEHAHQIFGKDPWDRMQHFPDRIILLPRRFLHDPKAFLTFVLHNDIGRSNFGAYDMPEQFRDDFTIAK